MALIDRVKYDETSDDVLVWKYPSESLKLGAQVIVNESQQAIFVKSGEVLDVLGPGTHTLNSGNIPLIDKIINFPFGGETPFTAEIWYVNQTAKRNLKWGTPQPIPLMDPAVGFPISLRAFGQWGIRVEDPRSFVIQLVGTQIEADTNKIQTYFSGEIIQKVTNIFSNALITNQIGILNLNAVINDLSKLVATDISSEFEKFGIRVINFNIESINIPKEELQKIQAVFEKKMEAEQLSKVQIGSGYNTIKTFDVLKAASENASGAGGVIGSMFGAGVGLGAGLPLGQQLGQQLSVAKNAASESRQDPKVQLQKLKELFDEGLIDEGEYKSKKEVILNSI